MVEKSNLTEEESVTQEVAKSNDSGEKFSTKDVLAAGQEDAELVKKVFEWSLEQLAKEKNRLSEQGASVIEVEMMDMTVIVHG